jgi:hypothetical protein
MHSHKFKEIYLKNALVDEVVGIVEHLAVGQWRPKQ